MGRAPCCDKDNVKRGPWSPEEDAKLKSYIETNGTGGNWIALPHKIGLKRCGKSCRLRWLNYLRPNIKHGGFSEEEDNIICNLYLTIGSRWSIIATELPGRTDNDIKNYWNTRLKKKLINKQRKELQEASMGQHEMMLMMTKRQQEVQTMFTWPLHQQVLTHPHDDQLTTSVMNQTNMFSDQEDVKPVIIKNIVKIEPDRTNPHQHQDSILNGFDNLSFSQLLLDSNNNHIGTGDQCFTTNSILSTSIDQYQNQEQEVLHQWFGNFQTKSFDLFSGTAMGTTTTTTTTTTRSSSGDQSTISWEELGYSEYKR